MAESETAINVAELRKQFTTLISAYSEERWYTGWVEGVEGLIRQQGGVWLALAGVCGWPQGPWGEEGWVPLTHEEHQQLAAMNPDHPVPKLGIIGRERALIDKLAKDIHSCVSKLHDYTSIQEERRGSNFELRIGDGRHIARVTVTLERVES